jgi:hypothetical protein
VSVQHVNSPLTLHALPINAKRHRPHFHRSISSNQFKRRDAGSCRLRDGSPRGRWTTQIHVEKEDERHRHRNKSESALSLVVEEEEGMMTSMSLP